MLLFLLSNCYFRRWRRWWSNNKFLSPPYQNSHSNSLNKFLSNLFLWNLSLVQVLFIYLIFILTKQAVLTEANQTITPLASTLPNNHSILSDFGELMINLDEESTEESITSTTNQQGSITLSPSLYSIINGISSSLENISTSSIAPKYDQESLIHKYIDVRLNTSSLLVPNCTTVEFKCQIQALNNTDNLSLNISTIWWSFRGNNVSASTLPGGRVINSENSFHSKTSILNVECAQFGVHDGDYKCHSSASFSFDADGIQPQHTIISSNSLNFNISVLILEKIDEPNSTIKQRIDSTVGLKCHVYAYPRPKITWQRYNTNTLVTTIIEPDGRIEINDEFLPDIHGLMPNLLNELTSFQSVLRFETLKRSDNGTYMCKATIPRTENLRVQNFNVIVLEVPEIHIEKIEIENKTTAVISFVVDYDGNLPIEKYDLEFQNFTDINSTWTKVKMPLISTKHNYSTIFFNDLVHAASYGFRLSASNKIIGQSEWSSMNITVPADVPNAINNVHLLSKSNETLLFGWRRPLHDNGAAITQFEQILRDSQNVIIWNQTINNTQSRNKHMSYFSNLQPGSQYSFTIRACSHIGCGDWSAIFEVSTSDGYSDPPENVLIHCIFDRHLAQTNATISWEPPVNPRGSIIGYNISLKGHRMIDSVQGNLELFEQSYQVNNNETFQYLVVLKPNSNHSVQICAINKSGCGKYSSPSLYSMCQSSPTVPSEFPSGMRLERIPLAIGKNQNSNNFNNQGIVHPFPAQERQLKFFVPQISQRNGPFRCIRVIVIRLPSLPEMFSNSSSDSVYGTDSNSFAVTNETQRDIFSQFLDDAASIPLSTYKIVHENKNDWAAGAYIAKEFTADTIPNEIIIGDGKVERCYDDSLEYDLKSRVKILMSENGNMINEDNRSPRRINYENRNETIVGNGLEENLVEDRELLPNTYYSAAIEVTVMAVNHTLLSEQSPFVAPVRTESAQMIFPQSRNSFSETRTGILYGTILALILILALVFFVLCFIKRKATETTPVLLNEKRIGLSSFIYGRKRKDSLFYQLNFNSTNSIRKWASKPIPLTNLVAVFQQRRLNSDFLFQAEFESLPESFPDRTTLASDAPENASKNRYPDIKSYDQTRVVLAKIDDTVGSDYINADFVQGYKNEKLFICAQGPTQRTVPDFWRLIYEQKCCIIVMLTGIEEQGRIKCAQYWNDNEPLKLVADEGQNFINNFEVTTDYRREYSDYVIRKFSLRNTKIPDEECHEVYHFHFVAWRDFLAPDQPSWLLRFIKRVNEHYSPDRGPILVHCSAGVGRTGTFLAIDILINQINDGAQEINVFECVSKLRHQRNFLVQSLRQYIFVYRAIMEYVEFGDTEIEITHIRDHYRYLTEGKTDYDVSSVFNEFEKLNEIFEDQKSCIVGLLDANRSKNRYSFIIPYDINRVILNPSQDSCYINASFIQGYDHTLTFIVAQDPMEHTVNEFWLMIVEHAVNTLVMLAELGDGQNKCHCYWPSMVNETSDCDFVKVKLIEEEIFQCYIKRVFHVVKKKTNKNHVVNQYQFLAWKSGVVVPESTRSLITFTDVILTANDSNNNNNNRMDNNNYQLRSYNGGTANTTPILVHCSGGGDRSSLFVAFSSLVKQLQLEERVDVFQTARYTKSQRHCMLQTIAQYNFLYRCLLDYMDCHHISSNADTQL